MSSLPLKITALLATGLSALILSGCATLFPAYQQNYVQTVQSWEGASESSLYKVWGYADQTQTLDNGNTLLIYDDEWQDTTPTIVTNTKSGDKGSDSHTSTQTVSTGGSYSGSCKTQFEVNTKKIIVNTAVRGDFCGHHYMADQAFIDSHSNKPFKAGTCYWNCT